MSHALAHTSRVRTAQYSTNEQRGFGFEDGPSSPNPTFAVAIELNFRRYEMIMVTVRNALQNGYAWDLW